MYIEKIQLKKKGVHMYEENPIEKKVGVKIYKEKPIEKKRPKMEKKVGYSIIFLFFFFNTPYFLKSLLIFLGGGKILKVEQKICKFTP